MCIRDRYVGEQEEIEEIVQETMMWLWENRCTLMEEYFRTALAGDSKEFRESSSSLIFAFLLAIVLIYLILAAQFESFKLSLLHISIGPVGNSSCMRFFRIFALTPKSNLTCCNE